MVIRILPWAILPLLASCVAPSAPAPTPAPRPVAAAPAPAPAAPAIAPERYAGEWSTADATPGDWRYAASGGGSARFGEGGNALAELRCANGTLTLVRNATINADGTAYINVRSSFGERRLPVALRGTGMLMASLPASDPLWDQLIYSRGRFLIEATRQAPIIVPNRAEVARVIEDCRGG
jgi:hypothetical protein